MLAAASVALGGCGSTGRCAECDPPAVAGNGSGGLGGGGSGGAATTAGAGVGGGGQLNRGGAPFDHECALGALRAPLVRYSAVDLEWTMQELFGQAGGSLPFTWEDRSEAGEDRRASPEFVSALWQVAQARLALLDLDDLQLELCGAEEDGPRCPKAWVERYGLWLYRRPLTTEQVEHYRLLLGASSDEASLLTGARRVLSTMLLSPYFVFRIELGSRQPTTLASPPITGLPIAIGPFVEGTRLDGFEVAARLSHFITRSSPDATLLEKAATTELLTPAGIEAEALRLLASPGARRARTRQHLEMLHLESLSVEGLSPEVSSRMLEQTSAFIDEVLSNRGGSLSELLTGSSQPLDRTLAEHYGIDVDASEELAFFDLDPQLYAGVLGQGAWLSRNPRPTLRARAIFDELLCNPMPPPPPDVTLDGYVGDTPRERIDNATAGQPCRGCHGAFDPTGFALEAFDEQGRLTGYDTTGALRFPNRTESIPVSGPVALGQTIAASLDAQVCAARRYLEHLLEYRVEHENLNVLLACLLEPYRGRDLDLNHLVVQVAISSVASRMTRSPMTPAVAGSSSNPVEHAVEETAELFAAFPGDDADVLSQYQQALQALQVSLAAAQE